MSSQNTQQQGPESERHRPTPDQQQGNSEQFGQAGEPGLPPEDDRGWRPEEPGERENQAEQASRSLEDQQAGDSVHGGAASQSDRTWAPEGRSDQVRGSGF